jgi:hypothetical protein
MTMVQVVERSNGKRPLGKKKAGNKQLTPETSLETSRMDDPDFCGLKALKQEGLTIQPINSMVWKVTWETMIKPWPHLAANTEIQQMMHAMAMSIDDNIEVGEIPRRVERYDVGVERERFCAGSTRWIVTPHFELVLFSYIVISSHIIVIRHQMAHSTVTTHDYIAPEVSPKVKINFKTYS